MATPRRSVAATLCVLSAGLTLASSACNVDRIDTNGPPPQAVPIRRLTNAEYTATVSDLFPGYTLPEMIFVPDA
ncbi:MAG TPA: hypothetical protein VN903_39395, partial [Polyangia bacterium]|nr:hypothetical protein [Polyangia bacterium]